MNRLLAGSVRAGATTVFRQRKSGRGGPRSALGPSLRNGVDDVALAIFQSTGVSFLGGNRVDLCDNGTIFDSLQEECERAQHSIHVDMYIWKPGRVGHSLAECVVRRARAGVSVRILVDPIGSPGFEEELAPKLQDAGCEVHFFRPPIRNPLKLWGRNHRKLVVIDGRVAFTGGFGIADNWLGNGLSPEHWRDSNIRVEGPVLVQMQQAFASHWLEMGGHLLPQDEFERSKKVGDSRACFVTSMDVKGLSNARWVTHIAMAAAQERTWIANAYFIPPPGILKELSGRKEDGIDVRILLPGPHIDHMWVKLLQHACYPVLRRSGVRLFEYQPSMIHSKLMLVDGRLVVVGSTNLDPLSQGVLEEGSLVVDDPAVAHAVQQRWEADMLHCKEVL